MLITLKVFHKLRSRYRRGGSVIYHKCEHMHKLGGFNFQEIVALHNLSINISYLQPKHLYILVAGTTLPHPNIGSFSFQDH